MLTTARAEVLRARGESQLIAQAWYFDKIQMPEAWSLVPEKTQTKIAVVDIDFDFQLPDLRDVFDTQLSQDLSGHNFSVKTQDAGYAEHGTLVSGVLAADGLNQIGSSGIVRDGRIIAVNVAANAPAAGISVESLAKGIRYAVDSGARVINCSIGILQLDAENENILRAAIEYAQTHDVVLVFSAGNYGEDTDKTPLYPASWTQTYDNIISVGASNRQDQVILNYGQHSVDLFAPGFEIMAPAHRGQYILSTGTSEAAPIVAGVVSLMREANPSLSAAQIKNILRASVDKSDNFKAKCISGGRLNAVRAVRAAKSAN